MKKLCDGEKAVESLLTNHYQNRSSKRGVMFSEEDYIVNREHKKVTFQEPTILTFGPNTIVKKDRSPSSRTSGSMNESSLLRSNSKIKSGQGLIKYEKELMKIREVVDELAELKNESSGIKKEIHKFREMRDKNKV